MNRFFLLVCSLVLSFHVIVGQTDIVTGKAIPSGFEKDNQHEIAIKANPLSILVGSVPLSAEYRIAAEVPLGRSSSYDISFAYLGKPLYWSMVADSNNAGGIPNPLHSIKMSGVRVILSYREYFSIPPMEEILGDGGHMRGPYWGTIISYAYFKISHWSPIIALTNYMQFVQFNAGIIIGYQIVAAERFLIDVFVGAGYKKNSIYMVTGRQTRSLSFLRDSSNYFKYYFGWFKPYISIRAGFFIG